MIRKEGGWVGTGVLVDVKLELVLELGPGEKGGKSSWCPW